MLRSLVLAALLVTSLAPAASAQPVIDPLPMSWGPDARVEPPSCEPTSEGDPTARCESVRQRLGPVLLGAGIERCVGRRAARGSASIDVLLHIAPEGHVTAVHLAPSTSLPAGEAAHACLGELLGRIPFGPGPETRVAQRWRIEWREPMLGTGEATPEPAREERFHLLGEAELGWQHIAYSDASVQSFSMGLRLALMYDWFAGLSASFVNAVEGPLHWSLRYALRPEVALGGSTALTIPLELGVAHVPGFWVLQQSDEVGLDVRTGVGVRFDFFVLTAYASYMAWASGMRFEAMLAMGTDSAF